jgi:hypothetical protein
MGVAGVAAPVVAGALGVTAAIPGVNVAALGILAGGAALTALGKAANPPFVSNIPGGTMETSAVFNRNDRMCTITRVSRSRECKNERRNGFFGIGGRSSQKCGEEKVETKVQEVQL